MKNVLVITLVLCWSVSVYADSSDSGPGSGAEGQSSWVGKSPTYFLSTLPQSPGNGCPAKVDADKQFKGKFFKAQKELTDEIGKRQRALKKWNEQNSKKMMENAVDMPGFEGKSQAEMKKMSKAERKKMAEKMMQDKFGVSMDDLKKQKKANADGNVMANVDFAKAMAGEQQANDLMKSKSQREADKRKTKDVGKLSKEQAELSQKLYRSTEGKFTTTLQELEQDKAGQKLKEKIYDEQERMAKMLGEPYKRPQKNDGFKHGTSSDNMGSQSEVDGSDLQAEMDKNQQEMQGEAGAASKTSCKEKETQRSRIHSAKMSYCNYMAPRVIKVLNEWRASVADAQGRYLQLDQVNSDLQKAQTGIGFPDAAKGLSGLEALQKYAAELGKAYMYDPGVDNSKDMYCGGEQPN